MNAAQNAANLTLTPAAIKALGRTRRGDQAYTITAAHNGRWEQLCATGVRGATYLAEANIHDGFFRFWEGPLSKRSVVLAKLADGRIGTPEDARLERLAAK